MEYSKGHFGRVFWVRFDHNDNLLEKIKELSVTEGIENAWFWCLGALKQAEIVTGPQETTIPPNPLWHNIMEAHELIGVGNIVRNKEKGEPAIHLHSSLGRAGVTRVGCIRKNTEVYLTIECVIAEISGIAAQRALNPDLGIATIKFNND